MADNTEFEDKLQQFAKVLYLDCTHSSTYNPTEDIRKFIDELPKPDVFVVVTDGHIEARTTNQDRMGRMLGISLNTGHAPPASITVGEIPLDPIKGNVDKWMRDISKGLHYGGNKDSLKFVTDFIKRNS